MDVKLPGNIKLSEALFVIPNCSVFDYNSQKCMAAGCVFLWDSTRIRETLKIFHLLF